MLEARYKSKEEFLEMQLEWAFVTRVTNVTDMAANELVSERAALQLRLNQVTSAARQNSRLASLKALVFVRPWASAMFSASTPVDLAFGRCAGLIMC